MLLAVTAWCIPVVLFSDFASILWKLMQMTSFEAWNDEELDLLHDREDTTQSETAL